MRYTYVVYDSVLEAQQQEMMDGMKMEEERRRRRKKKEGRSEQGEEEFSCKASANRFLVASKLPVAC